MNTKERNELAEKIFNELAEKIFNELGVQNDTWKSYAIKQALLEAYSAGVIYGLNRMADRLKANESECGAV